MLGVWVLGVWVGGWGGACPPCPCEPPLRPSVLKGSEARGSCGRVGGIGGAGERYLRAPPPEAERLSDRPARPGRVTAPATAPRDSKGFGRRRPGKAGPPPAGEHTQPARPGHAARRIAADAGPTVRGCARPPRRARDEDFSRAARPGPARAVTATSTGRCEPAGRAGPGRAGPGRCRGPGRGHFFLMVLTPPAARVFFSASSAGGGRGREGWSGLGRGCCPPPASPLFRSLP